MLGVASMLATQHRGRGACLLDEGGVVMPQAVAAPQQCDHGGRFFELVHGCDTEHLFA